MCKQVKLTKYSKKYNFFIFTCQIFDGIQFMWLQQSLEARHFCVDFHVSLCHVTILLRMLRKKIQFKMFHTKKSRRHYCPKHWCVSPFPSVHSWPLSAFCQSRLSVARADISVKASLLPATTQITNKSLDFRDGEASKPVLLVSHYFTVLTNSFTRLFSTFKSKMASARLLFITSCSINQNGKWQWLLYTVKTYV